MQCPFLRHDKGWMDFLTPGMSCSTDADFERQSEVNLGYIKFKQMGESPGIAVYPEDEADIRYFFAWNLSLLREKQT